MGLMPSNAANPFITVDQQTIFGTFKSSGSHDPDVLYAQKENLLGPYKNLKKYKPQDWNMLEIVVKDNVAHCTCNGEVLEAAFKLPETGPIGLEGDRGQMEYRRIRIQEQP